MSSAIRRRTNSGPRCSQTPNEWRDRFAAVPFEEQGGTWQTRYYQHNAIENALEAIAAGRTANPADARDRHRQDRDRLPDRLGAVPEPLELSRKPERRPRILFLADRNILADQAYNAFSAFPEDAAGAHQARRNPEERPRTEKRQRLLHDFPDLHERHRTRTASPRPISATIRPIFSTSSSSTMPSRRRQRRKQLARHSRLFLRRPCSLA